MTSTYTKSTAYLSGTFNYADLLEAGSRIKDAFSQKDDPTGKVYRIFMEVAENILRHGRRTRKTKSGKLIGLGEVHVLVESGTITITGINEISPENWKELSERCTLINSLDYSGQKSLKHELGKEVGFSHTSGNVGLVSIALLSKNHLRFKLNEETHQVFFSALIAR